MTTPTNAQIIDLARRIAKEAQMSERLRSMASFWREHPETGSQRARQGWSTDYEQIAAKHDDECCALCMRMRRLIKLGSEEGEEIPHSTPLSHRQF